MLDLSQKTVAVVGLGYVGLPLAIAFGTKMRTIGFDVKVEAITKYQQRIDPNEEVDAAGFLRATHLEFTAAPDRLAEADFIVVAVPTPIDIARQPDLRPVNGAAKMVGQHMKRGAVVIFESTVYPGVTEDVCVPILQEHSGLVWKRDFHVGYSPERINPGDKEHTLTKIVKVVSGDDVGTGDAVAALYGSIVEAGVYRTETIKEAEAAKVIENTQRDLNIALMNELSIIFDRLGIDTKNVLEAAGSKWNFLPFRPGLVGGHCIGVDPYYLTYKAETVGYHPEVILAGRRINDSMGKFIAEKTVKMMMKAGVISSGRVGVLGLTFKENCPDLRNSKVIDIIDEFRAYGLEVKVHDPRVDPADAKRVYGITLCSWEELTDLGALVFAVPHKELLAKRVADLQGTLRAGGCLIDVKSVLDVKAVEQAGVTFWRL
ncbi:MAG: nucleotide sugar dehydrogenase [Desulfobulbaceae bacterium]|nr:nucleotide sugar dehydrogenase [Desulfobulbaceae bacterium]